MKDDNKDYSPILDSEFNEQEPKPQEISDEKDKIYIPPDINMINNKKEELDDKDKKKDEIKLEINDSGNKNSLFELNKYNKSLINDIDFLLDDLIYLGPDKEKYKKLFHELRKRRENDEKITEEEYLLFDIMHQQFENPKKFNFDKIFNIDEKSDLGNINGEENGVNYFKVYSNLIKINKDITLEKKKEEKIIYNNYNNNKSNSNEKGEHKSSHCCIYCFASCLGFLDFFFNDCIEDHCECCISDKYEFLNLHRSFIFYIIQYLIYGIIPKFVDFESLFIISIVLVNVNGLNGLIIFYKLNYRKFSEKFLENTYMRFIDFISISLLKGSIYFFFYYMIKDGLENKNANEIFIVSFCFKIIFLILCSFHYKAARGRLNFIFIIIFGIIGILISSLILFFWFSLTEFIIELIICSIQVILFNLGIILSAEKELLAPLVIWNTLSIEIYKLSIFLYPVYIYIYWLFFIYTCGYFCCRY